jgi:small subunit ribosomal protein S16
MALKIRLRRMGRKKAPTYRIVVAESSMPRDGRFVATLGHYNPRTEPNTLVVNRDEARRWLRNGAKPTETVHSLLRRAGVYRDEPPAAEPVVEAEKTVAKKAAAAVAGAAAAVAGKITDAAEQVRETVTGAETEEVVAEAPAAEEPATEEPTAESPAAVEDAGRAAEPAE